MTTSRTLLEMADELHRRDPEALHPLVDIQSPMDIAARKLRVMRELN